MFGAQGFKQFRQTVAVDFLHQCQQTAEFTVGETLAGEPVQVRTGQVGDDPSLVFAEGHFAGDQQFEFFRVHELQAVEARSSKIQAFCMKAK